MKTMAHNGQESSMSWHCVIVLMAVALLLVATIEQNYVTPIDQDQPDHLQAQITVGLNHQIMGPPCDELYIVGEGETLYSIANKCGDPFIVDRNPHIHDPDDVFPGILMKLNPFSN